MLTRNLKMLCLSLIGTLALAVGSTVSAQDHFGGYSGYNRGISGSFRSGAHGHSSSSWVGGGLSGIQHQGGQHFGGFGGYSPAPFRPTPYYPPVPVIQRPVWHDTTHTDYHPGGYVPHGNHFDYQPGHYDLHRTGHWHN